MGTRRGRHQSVRQSVRSRPQPPIPIVMHEQWEDPDGIMIDMDPRRNMKLKNCCRSVTTFMCTQIGVGGIIVCYAIAGAFGFIALETKDHSLMDQISDNISLSRNETTMQLWNDYLENPINQTEWNEAAQVSLKKFQDEIVNSVKRGYDGRRAKEQWNFPAALMFTLSIFTMIGFGNLVPKTPWGKVITIFYAVFGIPLYILYFMNMGRALANTFKWIYRRMNSCSLGKTPESSSEDMGPAHPKSHKSFSRTGMEDEEQLLVPSSASLYVLLCYIAVGTILFAEWEKWDYLDSIYFCVTSLCKLGIGDFVPGNNMDDTDEGNQIKLVINFIYLLLGLGLVAMCYYLLKEEVLAKLKQLKSDIRDFCFYVRHDCSCDC